MDANTQAVDACQKAVELIQRLTREHPGEVKLEALLGTYLSSLGYYQHGARRFDRANESLVKAIAIWSKLVQDQPAEANFQNELARAYNNMGYLCSATGKLSEAIDYQERSLAIREDLARDHPENRVFRRSLAVSLSSLARRNTEARRLEEAVALRERCLRILGELRQEDPTSLKLQFDLASNFNGLGDVYRVGRKPVDWYERGMGAYRQALEMLLRLVREHPGNLMCKLELAHTYHDMALLCQAHRDYLLSLSLVEQEIAVREPILRPDPGAFYVKAAVLAELDRTDEAFALLARAIELFQAAEQKAKGAISHRRELRDCYSLRARWHMRRGAYSEAILDWQRVRDADPKNADATLALARIFSNGPRELREPQKAVAYAREAAERRPRHWQSTVTLGAACYRAGDFSGAIAAFQRARPLNRNRYSPFEWLFLAMSHQRLDESEAAREALGRAVDLMEREKPANWLLPNELENLRAEAEELLNED
jgi:tetratricopeptide (TPR) repeat protein